MAQLGKTYGCRLCDHFEMICGISTGGLIALGLSLGKLASDLVTLYKKVAGASKKSLTACALAPI
ncbi:hypothetical protein JAO77_05230 [Hymenobacter sp. BT559]|nr:hypothetical protein [Hymenobacter sp. BT559]